MLPATPAWTPPRHIDDVGLVATGGGALMVCASASDLGAEAVFLAEAAGPALAGAIPVADPGETSFRPALCARGDDVLAIACAGGEIAGLWCEPGRAPVRWRARLAGAAWHLALAAETDGTIWLAAELRRPGTRRIVLGRVDPATGRFAIVGERGARDVWCRWPALAAAPDGGVLLTWCEGPARAPGRVLLARARGHEIHAAVEADPAGGAGDAPALAAHPAGHVLVAWHAGGAAAVDGVDGGASVARSLRVSRWRPAVGAVEALPAPPLGPGGADPRGEDQSWELAAAAVDAAGALWLAGRSSHGHHIARLADGAWSARVSLCREAWGGRGRRMALVAIGDEIWLARRGPDGVEVRRFPTAELSPDGGAGPPDRAPGPAPVQAPHRSAGPAAPAGDPQGERSAPRSRERAGRVLFGDLHQHTAHSDGCGSAEDLWIAARERRSLDFAAVTDHDRFCGRSLGPATWAYLCQVADDFDEPGRFAALRGYEFTGARHPGPGHKCVYFGDRAPERVPDKDVAAVLAAAREHDGIAVPHHVGWTGGDFAHHDPAVQPVWELCSVHGCYEREGGCTGRPPRADAVVPGQFVRDALDAGLRFGFIASTDHHGLDWHHGVAPRRNPLTCGLAAVVGAEPTRAGVLAALRARRCYGTSGARIGLRVELDGAPLGSELPADTRGEVLVEVDAGDAAAVARVVLVTSSGETAIGGGPDRKLEARAPVPPADRPGFYVYVRVELEDGEQAWASPFWIG
jgi:hypothetical protein